jgi:hypothetical protein
MKSLHERGLFALLEDVTIRDSKEVNLCLTLEFKDVKKLVGDRKLDKGIMVLSPYLPVMLNRGCFHNACSSKCCSSGRCDTQLPSYTAPHGRCFVDGC